MSAKGNGKKTEKPAPSAAPAEPKKRLLHVTRTHIAETVVRGTESLYAVYDRRTEDVEYLPEFNGCVPMGEGDAMAQLVSWPSEAAPCGTDSELHADLCAYIRKWVDLEPRYERLSALYVMFSWAYQDFLEVPYLRIIADLGSGKTRLGLQVLGELCYRAFGTIAASSLSPLFRTIHLTGGTLILDEADMDNSDKNAEMVQMLNSGYLRKSGLMMRAEMGDGGKWGPKAFRVFGPKVIISRETFRDTALESRCLAVKLTETKRDDIPYLIDDSLMEEGLALRNRLLSWRFRTLGKARGRVDRSFEKFDVPARMKQLLLLMSSVVTDEEMTANLRELALMAVADNAAGRADSAEGEIAAIVVSFGRGVPVSCKEIADRFNDDKPTMAEKKHPRAIGWFLRGRLGLKTEKIKGDPMRRLCVTLTDEQIDTLCRKYDIPPPEVPTTRPAAECGDCYLNSCKVH